ncbi:metallophosphoesterase [Rothia sp. ZJ1223]|uniref:metallophosphoesterase n=1 Tax=Rothia sp. ZJ1223 TaxID=2811098 RepID=UPI001956D950|nr:metallophosphoesterase [Rothia sp. ZJ1223]MBM7051983.1 metallophosphoesterase [Rothia sp. ZJ1223]
MISSSPSAVAVSAEQLGKVAGATLATAVVAGAATAVYARYYELTNFTVRHEALPVLPAGTPDFRILHISDMHMIPGQRTKRDFIHSLAALEPNLVINTGDNLSHMSGLPALMDALDPLFDFPGVYVPGSNCYFAPGKKNPFRYLVGPSKKPESEKVATLPTQEMHDAFDNRGWVDLINRYETLSIDGLRLEFSGVDDPHIGYDKHPGFAPTAFDTEPAPLVRLGVAHAPYLRTLNRFVADGAQAIFAGHTHGGQVCLPGGRALVSNCDLPPARAKGLSYQGGVPVHVSAGLGTSRYAQVRLFCPPEAIVVTLTSR